MQVFNVDALNARTSEPSGEHGMPYERGQCDIVAIDVHYRLMNIDNGALQAHLMIRVMRTVKLRKRQA